ncbi:MAG: hypothetical protein WD696_09275 [Bryobacteraceae bacterium]
MRNCGLLLLSCALGLSAQTLAPIGLVRGELTVWDATESSGELSIRSEDGKVFTFTFDSRTYVEREKHRITMRGLRKADKVEIVSDRGAAPGLRYARMVHVVERNAARRPPLAPGKYRYYRSPTEHIVPRGNLTFTGIVVGLSSESLLLRTRIDGEKVILLRPDTRFLESGLQVEISDLQRNLRVFVRAGRNLDDEIEAYQVIWGEILAPNRRSHR